MAYGMYAVPFHIALRIVHEDVAVRRFLDTVDQESAHDHREIRGAVPSVQSSPGTCPQCAVVPETDSPYYVVPSRSEMVDTEAWFARLFEKVGRDAEYSSPGAEPKGAVRALRDGVDIQEQFGKRHPR